MYRLCRVDLAFFDKFLIGIHGTKDDVIAVTRSIALGALQCGYPHRIAKAARSISNALSDVFS
ncbi:MAG: hypothetical protein V6Z86_08840 [Hyphomicrobiales bacterium]